MHKRLSPWIMGGIIVGVLMLDQFTKYLTKVTMYLGQSIPVLGDFFKLTYVENPGMAFGVRINNPYIFMGLSIIAAIMVFYYLFRFRKHEWPIQLALSLISAGAIGNLMDRFIYGKVIDFFDVEFFDVSIPSFGLLGMQFSGYSMDRWPVFNIADSAVSVGMVMIFIYLIMYGDPLNPSKNATPDSSDVPA